jgi:AAA domain
VKSPKGNSSVLHNILEWSSDRPAWVRDALRRIVLNGKIEDIELIDLEKLCCLPHDAFEEDLITVAASAEDDIDLEAVPLSTAHLPSVPSGSTVVTLTKLGNLTNVNRLSPANFIEFGSGSGLTVIYGQNGAGKSGYARVIRKACRARGISPPIEPNIFQSGLSSPPCAEFSVNVDGIPGVVQWQDGMPTDQHLGRIFLFDARCADHYVDEDSGASFTPSGLDVLAKLSKICDAIKMRLGAKTSSLQLLIDTAKQSWTTHEGSKVQILLQGLSAITDESKLSKASEWTDDNQRRLDEIQLLLASNPRQKAAATRASGTRIKQLREKISAQIKLVSDQSFVLLRDTYEATAVALTASEMASEISFSTGYLPGTGDSAWRTLWEAARQFSVSSAYSDVPFPNVETGAQCVLCQTVLNEPAVLRLSRFENFVRDQTLQVLVTKRDELAEQIRPLESLEDLNIYLEQAASDLTNSSEVLSTNLSNSIRLCTTRKERLLAASKDGDFSIPTEALTDPTSDLEALENALSDQADAEEALHDPLARNALQKEMNEFLDRQWLNVNLALVQDQIGRLKKLARLQAAQADTATSSITSKTTSLTNTIVTSAFCSAFTAEIKALGLRTIQVELIAAGGQKGVTKFGVRIPGISAGVVSKIASEGERRCIAFALFLAELSQSPDRSSLVFDDPVSSVDHHYREKMAERLAFEALTRQVIVFTHDPVFLHDLQTQATKSTAALEVSCIQWNGNTPGDWSRGLPWKWKSPAERMDSLRKELRTITSSLSGQLNEEDEIKIRRFYSRLRATLERIIEHQIFGDAISRFRTYVNVKHVSKVVGFTQAEYDELKRLFDQCSDVIEGHDPALGQNKTLPSVTEMNKALDDTDHLISLIKTRQASLPKNGTP